MRGRRVNRRSEATLSPLCDVVLILGSARDVTACRAWPRISFDRIVAINNAWRVRPDWDVLIHPDDFPEKRHPRVLGAGRRIVRSGDFVRSQNRFGGVVYAGGTMAFTAGYWVLDALRPRVMAFAGCNMIYDAGSQTHFYGNGTADPLRRDMTLQDLGAKSARLMLLAAQRGTLAVNLSPGRSRLVFPQMAHEDLAPGRRPGLPPVDAARIAAIRSRETALGYVVESGRYWEQAARFDPARLAEIDRLWRDAAEVGRVAAKNAPTHARPPGGCAAD